MAGLREKIFRDSVHGYVHVPEDWCARFIDTDIFQRLRQIEQTSMRCLYPSAHHDRFVHSLGVYHLGRKAFGHLLRNSQDLVEGMGVSDEEKQLWQASFHAACLLHDCAHSPFSHTFEEHYDRGGRLDARLADAAKDDCDFERDLQDASPPAPHEKASSFLVLTRFSDDIRSVGGDPCLTARMILGCTYRGRADRPSLFKNALISLLNSRAIDVDKLDYITRDTWASGVHNTSVDIERLLAAVTVVEVANGSQMRIAFRKTALSVLQGVVDARNYLYEWIYGHHKVQYSQELLKRAVERLGDLLGTGSLEKIFSIEALIGPVDVGGFTLHLPTDGDIVFLLKTHLRKLPEAEEWLSRKYRRKALWKTYLEFKQWFPDTPDGDLGKMGARLKKNKRLDEWWRSQGYGDQPLVLDVKVKLYEMLHNDLLISVSPGTTVSFDKAFSRVVQRDPGLFYLYTPVGVEVDKVALKKFLHQAV